MSGPFNGGRYARWFPSFGKTELRRAVCAGLMLCLLPWLNGCYSRRVEVVSPGAVEQLPRRQIRGVVLSDGREVEFDESPAPVIARDSVFGRVDDSRVAYSLSELQSVRILRVAIDGPQAVLLTLSLVGLGALVFAMGNVDYSRPPR